MRLRPLRPFCPGRAGRVRERTPGERSALWAAVRLAGRTRLRSPVWPARPASAGATSDLSAVSGAITPKTADKPRMRARWPVPRFPRRRHRGRDERLLPRADWTQVTPAPSASQARALDPLERNETPVPVRSNALNVRFHCVWHHGRFAAFGITGSLRPAPGAWSGAGGTRPDRSGK
jgi:hypothetical protein